MLTETDRAQQFRILVTTEKLDLMLGRRENKIGRPSTLSVVERPTAWPPRLVDSSLAPAGDHQRDTTNAQFLLLTPSSATVQKLPLALP